MLPLLLSLAAFAEAPDFFTHPPDDALALSACESFATLRAFGGPAAPLGEFSDLVDLEAPLWGLMGPRGPIAMRFGVLSSEDFLAFIDETFDPLEDGQYRGPDGQAVDVRVDGAWAEIRSVGLRSGQGSDLAAAMQSSAPDARCTLAFRSPLGAMTLMELVGEADVYLRVWDPGPAALGPMGPAFLNLLDGDASGPAISAPLGRGELPHLVLRLNADPEPMMRELEAHGMPALEELDALGIVLGPGAEVGFWEGPQGQRSLLMIVPVESPPSRRILRMLRRAARASELLVEPARTGVLRVHDLNNPQSQPMWVSVQPGTLLLASGPELLEPLLEGTGSSWYPDGVRTISEPGLYLQVNAAGQSLSFHMSFDDEALLLKMDLEAFQSFGHGLGVP